ncbi:MAG: hypothetical protein Q9220_005883 [cf. Caloplaca sp. 1 TL-2023]
MTSKTASLKPESRSSAPTSQATSSLVAYSHDDFEWIDFDSGIEKPLHDKTPEPATQPMYAPTNYILSTYIDVYRGLIEQTCGDHVSQTFIAPTSKVSASTSTVEEDMNDVGVLAPRDESNRPPRISIYKSHEATTEFISPQRPNRPLVLSFQGYPHDKADVMFFLEHYLRKSLPRRVDKFDSGNTFVWEMDSAGIDHCERVNDGFKPSKITNNFGLIEYTASISLDGVTYHIASYWLEQDAPTLARPTREMKLRPELVSILEASDPPGFFYNCEPWY